MVEIAPSELIIPGKSPFRHNNIPSQAPYDTLSVPTSDIIISPQKNKKELTFFDFLLDEQHTHVASSRQHGTMALIQSDPRSERYHARAREKHAHMRARIYDIISSITHMFDHM